MAHKLILVQVMVPTHKLQSSGTFYLLYRDPRASNVVRVETFDDAERSEEEDRVFRLRKSGIAVKEIYSGPCSFCGCWLFDEAGRSICATCRAPLEEGGVADASENSVQGSHRLSGKLSHQGSR